MAPIPPLAAVLLAAAGSLAGERLLAKATEFVCENGAEIRQQHILYFLLKLTEGAD
jgi:hypothetical protein